MNFDIASLMNIMGMMNPKASAQSANSSAGAGMPNAEMLSGLMNMFGKQSAKAPPPRQAGNDDGKGYDGDNKPYRSASPFCAQNGIGERIDLTQSADRTSHTASGAGASTAQMPDMMNLLMNMFSQRAQSAKTASSKDTDKADAEMRDKNSDKDDATTRPKNDSTEETEKSIKNDKAKPNENDNRYEHRQNNNRYNNRNNGGINQNDNNKTQPPQFDCFEPIAFAGYGLRSALTRLYLTLIHRPNRADAHRTMR